MDQSLLNHLLQLVTRTGDRLVIVDPATQQPFVLMDVAQYEALVSGKVAPLLRAPGGARAVEVQVPERVAEDALAEQANKDIAAWHASQEGGASSSPPSPVALGAAPMAGMTGSGPGVSAGVSSPSGISFAPEPLQSATPEDDRFYVEPLE